MTSVQPTPFELVTDAPRLASVLQALSRDRRIVLDTESDGFHRYPEQLCLIQLAIQDRLYIVDPLAIGDMGPLGQVLGDEGIEKVLHAADYDIRCLDREWGFRIRNLYDTSIAARFTGMNKLGLATVVQELLGSTPPKEKRLQRADWSLRPLSAEALEYAAGDVRYLLALRELLGERLESLGRTEWVAEECARLAEVRHTAPDMETAFLSMKGSGVLDGKGLAVLKALCAFREAEARSRGVPPFRVLADKTLLILAGDPAVDMDTVPGLSRGVLRRMGRGLHRALGEGINAPRVRRPRKARVLPVAGEAERLQGLKAWRSNEGERLGLDPALLWPMPSLERLARAPETLEAELGAPEVRRWQGRHIAPALRAYLAQKR